jgi:hypothetical protein
MRACVLLGLLAGATAFSGPSPVGETSSAPARHAARSAARRASAGRDRD